MKFAEQKKLGPPGYNLNAVADALQLAVLGCPVLEPELIEKSGSDATDIDAAPKWYRPPAVRATRVAATFYVDAENGNDHNVGSKAAPFRTVAAAVVASRKTRKTLDRSKPIRQRPHQWPTLHQDKHHQLPPPDGERQRQRIQIYLAGGQTHWLEQTLKLGPADSSLSFSSTLAVAAAASAATGRLADRVAGQPTFVAPVVSGGILIPGSVQWTPHDVKAGKNIWAADLSSLGVRDVPGLRLDGERVVRARSEPHF
jgi:hypothetical protein